METAALTTAETFRLISASAATRSRSTWSMIAMSPGHSRLVRFLVRRSRRAGPATPGSSLDLPRWMTGILTDSTFIVLPSCQSPRPLAVILIITACYQVRTDRAVRGSGARVQAAPGPGRHSVLLSIMDDVKHYFGLAAPDGARAGRGPGRSGGTR